MKILYRKRCINGQHNSFEEVEEMLRNSLVFLFWLLFWPLIFIGMAVEGLFYVGIAAIGLYAIIYVCRWIVYKCRGWI